MTITGRSQYLPLKSPDWAPWRRFRGALFMPYAGRMSAATVELISSEAERIANANPPSHVLAVIVLGFFTALGWVAGRAWFHSAKSVAFVALAVRYGYRQGAKVPVEVKSPSLPHPA